MEFTEALEVGACAERKRSRVSKNTQSISIDYLTTGVYFLKVVYGNEVEVFKFMVVD